VTSLRTEVGIVEWARRTHGARAGELWLADAIGTRIRQDREPAEQIRLARGARVHGWHADLWKSVVPVLHDVDTEATDFVQGASDGDTEAVRARLEAGYERWRSEATVLAESPILRVLELIERDHEAFDPL
jgi:hypothetical protein